MQENANVSNPPPHVVAAIASSTSDTAPLATTMCISSPSLCCPPSPVPLSLRSPSAHALLADREVHLVAAARLPAVARLPAFSVAVGAPVVCDLNIGSGRFGVAVVAAVSAAQ